MTQSNLNKGLTPQNLRAYNRAKSSPSREAGCESPKARGAEPQPARYAAFLFLNRLGGSNGEAQASPVTLRVPRSLTPVRAAAQCESWSAVVHQAQLEINLTINTSGVSALPTSDLTICIVPRAYTCYLGTSQQLVAEGLVPQGFAWPIGSRHTTFTAGQFAYRVGRSKPLGHTGPMRTWLSLDHWCVLRRLAEQVINPWHARGIYEKSAALAAALSRGTPASRHLASCAYNARHDDRYQAFRSQTLSGVSA